MDREAKERRRSTRYPVSGVSGSLTFRSDARVVDLSLGGLSVETTQHLGVGKTYSIRLAREEGDELRLGGEVVRSRLRGTRAREDGGERGPIYEAGIRFHPLSEVQTAALRELLSASTEVQLDTPMAGRFDLGLPESVRLRSDYGFEVRKLSATGMLIESELAPRLDTVIELTVALGEGELRTSVRVAYVEEIGPGRYHLGVEFGEMSADDRELLDRHIARAPDG